MSVWTLGNVRIYVTDIETTNNQIIARLYPHESDTVHQVFGYEGAVSTIVCKAVGTDVVGALQGFTTSGLSYELISPGGSFGNFLVKSINFKQDASVRQTLRPEAGFDAVVYTTKIEILKV